MSEVVDRVALAISGSDDPANILDIHRSRARLAIEAMRVPTEEMIRAGNKCTDWAMGADEAWEEMIDKALA